MTIQFQYGPSWTQDPPRDFGWFWTHHFGRDEGKPQLVEVSILRDGRPCRASNRHPLEREELRWWYKHEVKWPDLRS